MRRFSPLILLGAVTVGLAVLPIELTFGQVALVNQLGLFAGPFAAALLVTRACEGSVRPLWRRMVRVRVRPFAYVIALNCKSPEV